MAAELNKAKAKAAELETSLDSSAHRVRCLGGGLTHRKAAQANEVQDAACRAAAEKFVQMDALQRGMTVLKHANRDSQAEVCRLTEAHAPDGKKTLRQQEPVLSDHHQEVRFLQE